MKQAEILFVRRWAGDVEVPPVEVKFNGRSLALLDPEDREQMERLAALVPPCENPETCGQPKRCWAKRLQAALREFANPKPRIEEPQGLGAVVERQDGEVAVSIDADLDSSRWADRDGGFHYWSDLDVVRVLSEGYEAGESE